MMISLFIIDFDGTLCATHQSIINCIQQTYIFFNLGPIPDDKKILNVLGKGIHLETMFSMLLNEAGVKQDSCRLLEICEYYEDFYKKHLIYEIALFDSWPDVLQKIKQAKIPSIILSNKADDRLKEAVSILNIEHFFDHIIGSNKMIRGKPHPDMFDLMIRPLYPEVPLSEILIVGDTNTDLCFAERCGFNACFATYGYGDNELAAEATYQINHPSELLSFIT